MPVTLSSISTKHITFLGLRKRKKKEYISFCAGAEHLQLLKGIRSGLGRENLSTPVRRASVQARTEPDSSSCPHLAGAIAGV